MVLWYTFSLFYYIDKQVFLLYMVDKLNCAFTWHFHVQKVEVKGLQFVLAKGFLEARGSSIWFFTLGCLDNIIFLLYLDVHSCMYY